jgi:hypothetical protein
MYELKRQNGLLTKVLPAVLGIFLLTAIFNAFTSEPPSTLSEELQAIANNMNKRTPIQIDSLTLLRNTQALSGNILQYNLIIQTSKENIDTNELIRGGKQRVINLIKTDPKAEFFRKNKVDLIYKYSDSAGNYVCQIIIPGEELITK